MKFVELNSSNIDLLHEGSLVTIANPSSSFSNLYRARDITIRPVDVSGFEVIADLYYEHNGSLARPRLVLVYSTNSTNQWIAIEELIVDYDEDDSECI